MEKEWIREMEEKGFTKRGKEYWQKLIEVLKGEPIGGLCKFSRKFEQRMRKKAEGEGGQGGRTTEKVRRKVGKVRLEINDTITGKKDREIGCKYVNIKKRKENINITM